MGIPASTFLSSRVDAGAFFGGQGRDTGGRWGGSFPRCAYPAGTKHLLGLAQAAAAGYGAYVLFVIQMGNVKYFAPNDRTDPAFGAALRKAAASGVQILAMDCIVTPDSHGAGQAGAGPFGVM